MAVVAVALSTTGASHAHPVATEFPYTWISAVVSRWVVGCEYRGRASLNHDTRHIATTTLAEHYDIKELAKITGHKDVRMLLRHYHPTAEDMAQRLLAKAG
jgi:integrase